MTVVIQGLFDDYFFLNTAKIAKKKIQIIISRAVPRGGSDVIKNWNGILCGAQKQFPKAFVKNRISKGKSFEKTWWSGWNYSVNFLMEGNTLNLMLERKLRRKESTLSFYQRNYLNCLEQNSSFIYSDKQHLISRRTPTTW